MKLKQTRKINLAMKLKSNVYEMKTAKVWNSKKKMLNYLWFS